MKPHYKPVIKYLLITGFYFLSLPFFVQAQNNYYISPKGNNTNNGVSKESAWQSLEKLNTTSFKPGDSILLEGNSVFNGTLVISSSGTTTQYITFSSYGSGKAIIDAGDNDGIRAFNISNVQVSNITVRGNGVARNKGNGIHFFSDDTLASPQNIIIGKCDAIGFHNQGIVIGCGEDDRIKGYKNVRITHCTASENGQAGIASYGSYTSFQNSNFYIAYCKVFNNRGIPGKTENHSGNGIVMGEVDSLLIEHCEAFENGADNSSEAGGPVGIWVWMCRNAIIQHCISHGNHAGLTKDGGGFDIDGGSSNCILQYNYSYNNEGAGYLLAEYGALFPFTNNMVRFNISENDGRKNNYGGIGIWGADSNYQVTNSYVYNNTIYSDDKNIINGTPAAIALMGTHFKNVVIVNNIFALKGRAYFINADTLINKSSLFLLHNNYFSYSNEYHFKYGNTTYKDVKTWLKANKEQELSGPHPAFLKIDPLFEVNNKQFKLQMASSLLQNKFAVFTVVENGKIDKDYCNNILPMDGLIIPGACIK
ncbi:MAG: right-handed parallel beta-helix repeat-containing protein [Panacibacter sp.]